MMSIFQTREIDDMKKQHKKKTQEKKIVSKKQKKQPTRWTKKILILFAFLFVSLIIALYFYFKNPTISVVMPTYNRIDLLSRSIESILNQTYKDFEFIIVDDGSTDDSVALIQAYQKQDKRIRLIQNETNKGISFSRNRGMDAAKGRYLAIMDSDDYSEPERLEKSLAFMKKHKNYVVVNSIYYEIDNEDQGVNNWVPPHRWEIIFHFANYFTNIAMFDLKFAREHNIRYDENLISGEDYDFWSKIFLAGGKFGMINEPLIRLRRHSTNKPEYYKTIHDVRKTISQKLLARFDVTPEEALKHRCRVFEKMMKSNRTKKLVDQYTLELTYRLECIPHGKKENSLYVKHFDFVDEFIPQGNNVYTRLKTNEQYTKLYQAKKKVIFINPKGKEEVYRIQNDGSYGFIEDLGE